MLKALEEEEAIDAQMRQQYQQKWSRLPSNALNQQFKHMITDFQQKTSMAAEQDVKIESKFASHGDQLKLLNKSKQELAAMIPQSQGQ